MKAAMKFTETKIPGVYVVEIERLEDVRGFFARTGDEKEGTERGLEGRMGEGRRGWKGEGGGVVSGKGRRRVFWSR